MSLKNKLKHVGMAILAAPLVYGIGWLAVNGQKANPSNRANANPNLETIVESVKEAEVNEPNNLSYVVRENAVRENVAEANAVRKTYDEPNSLVVKVSEANVINLTNIISIYSNPKYEKDDNFASDSNEITFARAVYGEARGELRNRDYAYGFTQTVKNRANIKNKSVKEILLENRTKKVKDKNGKEKEIRVWQYSSFSPKDVNYKKLKDPIKFSGEAIWRECHDFAREMLNKDCKPANEIQKKLETATNYWVDIVEPPSWAYENNDKKKDLREPLEVIPVRDGKNKAYFYSFKYP